MLDINIIKKRKKEVEKSIKSRGLKVDLNEILYLDDECRLILSKVEELRAKRNDLNDQLKETDEFKKKEIIEASRHFSGEIKELEPKLEEKQKKLQALLYQVPNLISEDTPYGKSEKENKVLRRIGRIKEFDFKPKDHIELGKLHNLIDTEKSAKISGSRFNYLFSEAVLLQFALIQFGLEVLSNKRIIKKLAIKVNNPFTKPFVPVIVPAMVKSSVMKKMDRFDPVDDRYYFEKDDVALVGSTEHTLGPLHMKEIIKDNDLPIRYVGYSTAFRREAGSYGADTSGIIRRHQFDQLEMESFVLPEYGLKEQDLMIAIQEYLMQKLEIPYRVVLKCTGDMGGKADFRAIDIECFMPGEGKYRETHTSDYMTDYQSRRLGTKYIDKNKSKNFVHMNDATVFAIGRTLIAILENYQEESGKIMIPEALRKYMGGLKKIG